MRGGNDLSQAMGKHPRVFPDIYVNMIKAGEASGQIDTILSRLAEYQEASETLKREIKSAMTYPVISITMVLGITIFLLVFIIPKFKKIFDDMGIPLPLPTRIVLGASKALTDWWYIILPMIAGVVVAIIQYKKTESGRYVWDSFMLKTPVFGGLIQKVALSRFSRHSPPCYAVVCLSSVPLRLSAKPAATPFSKRLFRRVARVSVRVKISVSPCLSIPSSRRWLCA